MYVKAAAYTDNTYPSASASTRSVTFPFLKPVSPDIAGRKGISGLWLKLS